MVAFLYPGYASYKVLSQRPASEEELERWLMYWTVLGFVVGVEYVAEWTISWYAPSFHIFTQSDSLSPYRIPFYYTLKTLFLLYIALPQTKGSSYLYKTHLQPFFRTHETEIDTTLAHLKARLYSFLRQRARMLWDQAAVAIGQTPSYATNSSRRELEEEGVDSEQSNSLGNSFGGPMQLFSSLWGRHGPNILAGGLALIGVARAQAQYQSESGAGTSKRPDTNVLTTPPSSRSRATQSRKASRRSMTTDRRHRLEAESDDDEIPVRVIEGLSGGSVVSSRSSSNSIVHAVRRKDHVRSRSPSGGSARFEEVEVPSDAEIYEEDQGRKLTGTVVGGWFGGWDSAGVGG